MGASYWEVSRDGQTSFLRVGADGVTVGREPEAASATCSLAAFLAGEHQARVARDLGDQVLEAALKAARQALDARLRDSR